MYLTDRRLREILADMRVVACVGASPDPVRPSHYVARYLTRRGMRVIPVNPRHAGVEMLGEQVVASLSDIPADAEVDCVDIFRRSDHVPAILDEALAVLPALRTVWMQIGVADAEAAARAEARGMTVVQNLCPKMEHQRLFGDLRKSGIATGIISSRL